MPYFFLLESTVLVNLGVKLVGVKFDAESVAIKISGHTRINNKFMACTATKASHWR